MPDDNGSAGYRLDDEERSIVGDCLAKERLSLTRDRFECLVAAIGASMAHFRAMARESTFRDAHDALREMWELSHDDDPQIGVLRARLKNLPRDAIEELGRRAPTVIRRLFCTGIGDEPFVPRAQLRTFSGVGGKSRGPVACHGLEGDDSDGC
jgi:hypothetical protein